MIKTFLKIISFMDVIILYSAQSTIQTMYMIVLKRIYYIIIFQIINLNSLCFI